MGWWKLPGSTDEVMGDEAADAAVDLLDPLKAREPRPSLDELLDGLEAALDGDRDPPVVSDRLGGRRIVVGAIPRARRAAADDLVAALRPGLEGLREVYQESFQRLPSVREVLEAISFVLCPRPKRYLRDVATDKLEDDLVAEPG